MTTHEAINLNIKKLEDKIEKLRALKHEIKDEPMIQKCPHCGTMNKHFYAESGHFICSYC